MRLDRIRNKYIRGTGQQGQFMAKARVVWACAEEGCRVYLKNVAAKQEQRMKTKEEVQGHDERRHARG